MNRLWTRIPQAFDAAPLNREIFIHIVLLCCKSLKKKGKGSVDNIM